MNRKAFWLGLMLILCFRVTTDGQSIESPQITGLSAEKTNRNDYLSRLVYATVSGDTLWKQMLNIGELKGVLNDVLAHEKMPLAHEFNKFEKVIKRVKDIKNLYKSTHISANYYATNVSDTMELGTPNSDFMNLNAALNLEVAGLPFSVQSSLVVKDGRLESDFSYTNLRFDLNKYQDDWRSKVSKKALQEYINFDKITEGVHLSRLDSTVLSKDMAYTLYSGLMNNPKITNMRERINYKIDSIKEHVISRFLPKSDSLMLAINVDSLKTAMSNDSSFWHSKLTQLGRHEVDSLLKNQKVLNQMVGKYDSLWQKRKGYLQQMDNIKSKFLIIETTLKTFENFDSVANIALKSGGLKLKDKLMLKVKGLETGQFGGDEQEFIMKNQLLNGVKFEYGDKKRNWGIIVGRSRLQALSDPVFYNPFQRLTQGRAFILLKMGLTLKDASRLTVRLMNVHKTQDSLFQGNLTPNYNSVLGLTYDKSLSKNWSIQADAALSNVRQSKVLSETDFNYNPLTQKNWALSGTLMWQKWEAFNLGLGYYYVGNGFYTFGNDFLINNRNGVKAELKSSLFKKKLKLECELKRGVLNEPLTVGLKESALLQMRSSATWLFGKSQTIQFQYMPNTLTERQVRSDGRGFDYQSNIYLLTGNFSYSVNKMKQSTVFMLSNVNQQIDYFDTLQVTKTNYVSCRHEAFLSKKNSLIFKMNSGFSDIGFVQTGQIQMDAKFLVHKYGQFTCGLQAVKKRIEPYWRAGLVGQMQLKLSDKLNLRSGVIYRRRNTERGANSHDEWIANSALTMQF